MQFLFTSIKVQLAGFTKVYIIKFKIYILEIIYIVLKCSSMLFSLNEQNKFSDCYTTPTIIFSSLLHYFCPVVRLESQNREPEGRWNVMHCQRNSISSHKSEQGAEMMKTWWDFFSEEACKGKYSSKNYFQFLNCCIIGYGNLEVSTWLLFLFLMFINLPLNFKENDLIVYSIFWHNLFLITNRYYFSSTS